MLQIDGCCSLASSQHRGIGSRSPLSALYRHVLVMVHSRWFRRCVKIPSLTTNVSQKFVEPSKRISYTVGDHCTHFTKLVPMPIHFIVIRYPKQMVQRAFCDFSPTFPRQVTNVFWHVFVILPWGILTSTLTFSVLMGRTFTAQNMTSCFTLQCM